MARSLGAWFSHLFVLCCLMGYPGCLSSLISVAYSTHIWFLMVLSHLEIRSLFWYVVALSSSNKFVLKCVKAQCLRSSSLLSRNSTFPWKEAFYSQMRGGTHFNIFSNLVFSYCAWHWNVGVRICFIFMLIHKVIIAVIKKWWRLCHHQS